MPSRSRLVRLVPWLVLIGGLVLTVSTTGLLLNQEQRARDELVRIQGDVLLDNVEDALRLEIKALRQPSLIPARMAAGEGISPSRFAVLGQVLLDNEFVLEAVGWASDEGDGLQVHQWVGRGSNDLASGTPLAELVEQPACATALRPARTSQGRDYLLLEPFDGCRGYVLAQLNLPGLLQEARQMVAAKAYEIRLSPVPAPPMTGAGARYRLIDIYGARIRLDVVPKHNEQALPYIALLLLGLVGLVASWLIFHHLRHRLRAEQRMVDERDRVGLELALQQALFRHAPDGILVVGPDVRIEQVNEELCRMLGYECDELLGRSLDGLIPEPYRAVHQSMCQSFIEDTSHDSGYRMAGGRRLSARARDGGLVPVEIGLSRIEDGGHVRTLAFVRDRSATEQLERQWAMLETVIDSGHDFVLVIDATGKILYLNGAFLQLAGLDPASDPGAVPLEKVLSPEEWGHLLEQAAGAATDETAQVNEISLPSRDGRMIPVSRDLITHRDAGGTLRWIACIYRDISAAKQLEADLRRQRSQLLEVQRLAHLGSWEYDLVAKRLTWSDETYRIFGVTPGQLEPLQAMRELVHPQDRQRLGEAWHAALREHTPYEVAHRICVGPDATVRHVYERAEIVYADDGTPLRAFGTVQDITDRVAAERLAQELDDAQAASRAKSAFLATMSHEIRTPLHGIIGTVDLLEHTTLDEHQKELLKRTRYSAKDLLAIISDVLDFSKIEAGRLELERQSFLLRSVLEQCAVSLAALAEQRGVRLIADVAPEIDVAVVGDSLRLRQVISNLLGNAIKFTAGRPAARVLLRARQHESTTEAVGLTVEVEDNGIGIEPAQLERLFDPFVQAEEDTTRRFGGTGLGLAISRELVQLMGGEIEADSIPDHGSTFRLRLSLPRSTELVPPRLPDLSGVRVLALVDDADEEGVVRRHLEYAGAEVQSTSQPTPEWLAQALSDKSFALLLIGERLSMLPMTLPVELPRVVIIERSDPARPPMAAVGVQRPLCRDTLLAAVARALGEDSGDIPADEAPLEALPEPAILGVTEAEEAGRLLLVAEDNEVNQDVIREQLRQLGLSCLIAGDGREALELYHRYRFAALLTDCHMPHLDGYGLAEAIRQTERGTGRRIPIIAITADASTGEARHCRASGMDDCLIKPMEIKDLRRILARWVHSPPLTARPSAAPFAESAAPASSDGAAAPLDPVALTRIIGDDPQRYRQFLGKFLAGANEAVAVIENAAREGAVRDAAAQAHKLKSSARAMGANALAEACQALETAGKEGQSDRLGALARKVSERLAEVVSYVSEEGNRRF